MHTNLQAELQASIRGDVQFDDVSRALYATDASIYQIAPLGVVLPRDEQDVATVLRLARRYRVPLLPRGGGTSLAGQTVGAAIQLDFSKYMHQLLELNVSEGWAWVQPGMVLDTLNAQLAPTGLQFAPDVSPSNRATIGGMIGNNSSGMYSLVYGKTIDHVLELRVMLADGSITTLGPLDATQLQGKLTLETLEGRCYRVVRRLAGSHTSAIEQYYPNIMRRVGGYNLDAFVPRGQGSGVRGQKGDSANVELIPNSGSLIPDPRSLIPDPQFPIPNPRSPTPDHFNLAHMIVGSEGTLALVLAAKLRLVPRPAYRAIGMLAFPTLDAALDAVLPCLECRPAAVELLDDMLLDLTRKSREYGQYLAMVVQGEPGGLLQVEFFGTSPAAVAASLDRLEATIRARSAASFQLTRCLTAEQQRAVIQVRKASLPLLMSISPDLKPETFVEDSAVAPERLPAYIRAFRTICQAQGVPVAIYGHASVGLIHARPLLNLKQGDDVRKMRVIAEAIKDLVIEFGGALSGEHGDGLLRSEFNRELFGEELYAAFGEIKRTFDPYRLLNPGKIVDAPPMDANLRYGASYQTVPLQTHYRFADSGGFAGAAELCNGNGLCRKTSGGTMCPSYMVTRDEEHSTRGRANALRMALSGALPPGALTSQRMKAVLDLCVECKGCTGECPSRVNMTRLKSEWLAHYYAENGVPLRAWLFGHIRQVNQLGSALAPLANRALRLAGAAWLAERLLGISRQRRLPTFAAEPFDRWFAQHRRAQPPARVAPPQTVVLFPDTFTNYNEPQIGRAAVQVLEAAGFEVLLPRRRLCCGRPLISKGLLAEARALAQQQLTWLAPYAQAGLPIVGLEPSCILTFRDEYPDLLDDPRATALAQQTFLIDEFLLQGSGVRGQGRATSEQGSGARHKWGAGASINLIPNTQYPIPDPRPLTPRTFLFHGHCHQKALIGTSAALALLRQIPGATVSEVDSGCCGMAGSFGYEHEHQAISMRMAERALLPAVRALPPDATIVAMGTSCRQQIADATGRRAVHLVEVLSGELRMRS